MTPFVTISQETIFQNGSTPAPSFTLAEFIREVSLDDFPSIDQARRFIFDTIANFRQNKGHGIIADFYREHFDEYLTFTKIGEGSMGGKARGLAFLDYLINKTSILKALKT